MSRSKQDPRSIDEGAVKQIRQTLTDLRVSGLLDPHIEGGKLRIPYDDDAGNEIDLPPSSEVEEDALVGLLYRALVLVKANPTLAGKAEEPVVIAFEDRRKFEEGPTWYRLALALASVVIVPKGSRAGGSDV